MINGISGETIVRDEIEETEKQLKINNIDENSSLNYSTESFDGERDFTFEERIRIANLDKKMIGLQNKTFENIKEELYNAKELLVKI